MKIPPIGEYKSHSWGDPELDWEGLDEAIRFIDDYTTSYGRMFCYSKEKWGMARISVHFWHGLIYSLLYPRHARLAGYKWLLALDWKLVKVWRLLGVVTLVHHWQTRVYTKAFTLACERWPHLIPQILAGGDHHALLKDLHIYYGMQTYYKTQECREGHHTADKVGAHCQECFEYLGDDDDNL